MGSFSRQFSASLRKNFWLQRKRIGLLICCQFIIPLLMTAQTVMLLYLPRLTGPAFSSASTSSYAPTQMSSLKYISSMCKNESECYFAFSPLNATVQQQMEPYYSQWRNYLIPSNSWTADRLSLIFLNDAEEMDILAKDNKLYGGVVFDGIKNDSHADNAIPSMSYRIRLAAEDLPVPPPMAVKSNPFLSMIIGFGLGVNKWAYSGFFGVQEFVDNAYIRWAVDRWNNVTSSSLPRPYADAFTVRYGPQYPNPPMFMGIMISQAMSSVQIAFIGPVLLAAMDLVRERSSRIREYLKIMGLRDAAYWMSWIVTILGGELFCLALVIGGYYGVGVVTSASLLIPVLNWIACCFALICFGLLVATVAPTPTVVTVVLLFWMYGTSQIGFFLTGSSFAVSVALCFIAPIAGQFAGVEAYKYELLSLGVSRADTDMLGAFPLWLAILMQFVDGILYLILTWYVSNLRGSGIDGADGAGSRPWYFPFTKTFWCPTEWTDANAEGGYPLMDNAQKSGDFEESAVSSNPAIRLKNLRKVYASNDSGAAQTVAVQGLDLDVAENQIFCLLGENGAGKTTTIAMLTGLTSASDGDAVVGGFSIKDQLEQARNSISICPQHDMLMEELSGRQHLTLFARLKGVPEPLVEAAVDKVLVDVNLTEKADVDAKAYSGGMKRRLSLAISLVADSRVVFLDEPSSGLDPVSRRQVWDMLKSKREGKCIVLTTHFMEEAEVLADRIGIMSFGRLVCAGSPEFLKHRFGTGYALTVALDEKLSAKYDGAAANLVDFVQGVIPSATLVGTNGQDVTIRLPFNTTKSFPDLFGRLENNLSSLGATTFGVAMTTLEDVFLAISRRESESQEGSVPSSSSPAPSDHEEPYQSADAERGLLFGDNSAAGRQATRDRVLNGKPAPFFQQVKLMLRMRTKLAWRSKWSFLASLIYPIVIAAIITYVGSGGGANDQIFDFLERHANGEVIPLNITSSLPLIVPAFINTTRSPSLSAVQNLWRGVSDDPLLSSVTFPTFSGTNYSNSGLYDYMVFNRSAEPYDGVGAFIFDSTSSLNFTATSPEASLVVMSNRSDFATYSAPSIRNFATNLMFNAMLRTSEDYVGDALKIYVSSWPFLNATNSTSKFNFRPPKQETGMSSDQAFLIAIAATFSVVLAGFGQTVVSERFKKQRKQLELAGALSTSYWVPLILMETAKLFCTYCLIYLLVALPFSIRYYTAAAAYGFAFFVDGFIFCFGFVVFNCAAQRLFNDPESCRKWLMAINLGSAAIPFLIPFIVMFVSILTSRTSNAPRNEALDAFAEYAPCASPLASFLAGLHSLSKAHDDKLTSFGDVFSWKYNGKWIVFSVIHLGLFAALNFFLEKRSLNIRRHPYRPPQSLAAAPRLVDGVPVQPPVQFIHQDDPDVAAERVRVASAQQDPIRVVAATKFYSFTRAAVDDVTFSVRPHECFGLLGPNGAGKTTLISGITGEVPLGFGDIQIESKSIYDHDVSTLFRSVALGECMQIDALFDDLTTAELVELFIGLRNDHSDLGAQAAQIGTNAVVTDILDRMRLASHRNKRSKALSGGNKRKLSTATALLTGTHICLLDEPSTGMDPSMRRVLWNVLKQEREERGSSILLTTHSMEEAEATCTRISIMVMGKLQCIGSNQHLKSRYGEAYRLHVVLDLTKSTPANIDAFVQKTFGQCVLIEGHGAHGTYDVGVVKSISAAFAALEENMQSLGMLSYSLSQSTLEQIFLQFAKRQEIDPSN